MRTSAWPAPRVLERVGQPLLHDAVGGQVDRRRAARTARRRRAGRRRRPALRTSSSSASSRSRPGAGASSACSSPPAHRAEQPAHLGERRAPGLLDAPQRLGVLGRRVGQPVPDRAGLQHHHADGVGDDVVQLAGDRGRAPRRPRRAPPTRARARPCAARSSAASACVVRFAVGASRASQAMREDRRDHHHVARRVRPGR